MKLRMRRADFIAGLLAAALVAAFIGAIIMLSWREIPSTNEQLLTYMLGQLSGFVAAAIGMYFARRPDNAPSGTVEDPIHSEIGNKPTDPVPTTLTEGETK